MAERDESFDTGSDGRTELRVHGVSGTSAETILAHPLLKRVAGDGRAGFFRRWYPGGRSADLGARDRLEACSWGGLTPGPAARAAWLLLLPLMLLNLAHWMLPAVPSDAGPPPGSRRAGSGRAAAPEGVVLTLTMLRFGPITTSTHPATVGTTDPRRDAGVVAPWQRPARELAGEFPGLPSGSGRTR